MAYSYSNDKQLYLEEFQSLVMNARGREVRTICPFCNDRRSNKKDKCLAINTENLVYYCHYCNATGILKSKMNEYITKEQKKYMPKQKIYKKPPQIEKIDTDFPESFLEYFKKRGISKETLVKAKVTKETHSFGGEKSGCIAFNYFLEDELIYIKYRTKDKKFSSYYEAKPIPYNINSIAPDSFSEGEEKYCIYVEGEIDALTWIECGFPHVVSVPCGANTTLDYLDDFIDSHFDKLDYIYLSVDNDRKGTELKDELLRRFGRDMCRIIEYPKPCKDINEVLVQYGKDKVKECFTSFIELKPDGVQELGDVEYDLDNLFTNGLQKGCMVGVQSIDKILSFKTGMLNVVTGVPSHGKTYMLNYLLVKLNILHNWKIAFFSPEFYPVSLHIAQIIETMGGMKFTSENYNQHTYEIMKEYLCRNMFWIDPNDTDINSVLDRAKYLIRKKGIKALVIDPFNSLTDNTRKNQKQDEYISDFLQKLRWFARKYNIAIFLVMHPTKLNKLDNGLYPVCDLYNCKGASEIFDKADMGLTVWRNEQDDYAELHVTKIKFRHLGEKGKAAFRFNINNGRYVEIGDVDKLKNDGVIIRNMTLDWDNSNYVINKLKGNSVQQTMPVEPPKVETPKKEYPIVNPYEMESDDVIWGQGAVPF